MINLVLQTWGRTVVEDRKVSKDGKLGSKRHCAHGRGQKSGDWGFRENIILRINGSVGLSAVSTDCGQNRCSVGAAGFALP